MNDLPSNNNWEADLAQLLADLSDVQEDLLQVLAEKRARMVENDAQGMAQLQPREQQVADRLQACHRRRHELLQLAGQQGLPADSIRKLAASMPHPARDQLGKQVQETSARMRLLQHHSLTNWVLAQRTLLHLSQLLEIIATGGQLQPTYSKEEAAQSRGALVDRAA